MPSRSDTFDRSNNASSLGTPSDGGSAWVTSDTWGIVGNAAYNAGANSQSTAVLESSLSDVTIQVTMATVSGVGAGAISARWTDASNYLLVHIAPSSNVVALFKNVAGSFTLLGSISVVVSDGDVFSLICNGSTLTVKQNGITRITATDSFNLTATKHGLRSDSNSAGRFNDFSIVSLVVGFTAGTASVSSRGFTTAAVTATAPTSGTTPYTYQWQRKTGSGGTYANVSGATSLTLNDTGLTRGTVYYYRCVQTDSLSAVVTSNEVSLTTCTSQIVVLGNSQSLSGSWPDTFKPYIQSFWSVLNQSVGGKTTTAMITDAPTNTVPYLVSGNTNNLVIVQEIMNDIYYGATGASAYANLVTLSNLVRNVNGSKLVVLLPQPDRGLMGTSTLPGADDAAKQAEYRLRIQDFLTLFFANWRSICDSYLYFNEDPRFGDINNGTMFVDTVHWGTPLQQAVAYGAAYAIPLAYHPGKNRIVQVG